MPALLPHLEGEFRDLALYALQYCWSPDAADAVARLLADPVLETRRMAGIVLDRHFGREYFARRCAAHIDHPHPEVSAWCFDHAELMFPDLGRVRAAFARPHMHQRLARRLARYYDRSLAPQTRGLLAETEPAVVRSALVSLIHHEDGDAGGRATVRAQLASPHAAVREAAAEYLAWRGEAADLPFLVEALSGESDELARASLADAARAIERRPPAGADLRADDEPFEPRWFYTGAKPEPGFVASRRTRALRLASTLGAPWADGRDPEQDCEALAANVARSLCLPTRDAFSAGGESFGVHTREDDRAFKSLVHVGTDLAWQQDHASVVAIADGVVRAVRCTPSWGYIVIVEHAVARSLAPGLDDYAAAFAATIAEPVVLPEAVVLCSLYAHLSPFVRVRPGAMLRAGDKIGAIGRTFTWENGGYPAHLHFGVHLGPFVQTPLQGSAIDISYRGRRYRGRVVGVGGEALHATIAHGGDPAYPVWRTRLWECGYIARWYWDSGAHGWINPPALLAPRG